MNTINWLYEMNIPLIFSAINLIIGSLLCFAAYRWHLDIISILIGTQWGIYLGGLIGYLLFEKIFYICAGGVIGALFFLVISKVLKRGVEFIICFIFTTKISFMFMNFVIGIVGTDYFYEVSTKYLVEDDILLCRSLIIGFIGGISMLLIKVENNKIYTFFYVFIGVTQLIGISEWIMREPGYEQGVWEELFIPLLSIKCNNSGLLFLIFALTCGCYDRQLRKISWQKGEESF